MLIPLGLILVVAAMVLGVFGLIASKAMLAVLAVAGLVVLAIGVRTLREMELRRRQDSGQ